MAIGVHGAKLSVQFGRWYLDENDPDYGTYPYTPPTSLQAVINNGGNFWIHGHNSGFAWTQSTYSCVKSAYRNETGSAPGDNVAGRSGGWKVGGTDDWLSITVGLGIRKMNSAVMAAHALVPTSMRPYGLSDDELSNFYFHDAAPGPLDSDVMTMRIRPFWMNTASTWFEGLNTIYPSASQVGSVMMIPAPGRFELRGMADRRTAQYPYKELTDADLKCALTEIWSTYELGRTAQDSITRVWYTNLNPDQINSDSIQTITAWVQSVNDLMDVGGGSPKAAWANMNEIADLFSHTTSFHW